MKKTQLQPEPRIMLQVAIGVGLLIAAALICGVFIFRGVTKTSKINNQNPTGCAYGDSIPVDSEKCSAETFRDKSMPATQVTPTTLPEVGGSGK